MYKKKLPVYCADFETTSMAQYKIEQRTRVYLWCIKSVDEQESYMGCSIDEFFAQIGSFDKDIICYFHNLSFDGEFIMWWLLEQEYEYCENLQKVRKPKTFEPTIDDSGSIFSIRVMYYNVYIEFRCSYKLFPKSIEDIGEMVGIMKLKETHNYEELKNYNSIEEVTSEEKMYINNDVLIMCKLIKYLNEIGINGITMSSSAYKNWRSDRYAYFLSKNQLIKDSNDEINEIVRKSYRGGITKVNPKYAGKEFDDVISFDVNSLYPSVMYDNPMPVGMGCMFNSIEECRRANYPLYIVVVEVATAKVRDGFHSFIGSTAGFSYSRKYEYNDELENTTLYLWDKEFELFEQIYDYVGEISKVVGYKQANNVFKDYIDRWYKVKENARTPAERQLAKLMLNSLYGKFGMNDCRESKIPVGVNEDGIIYNIVDKMSCYYDKKIASFITSRARTKFATFMNLAGEHFIYGDTDSIYYWGHDIPKIFDGLVDPKKMGYWKYEGHYTRFKALKAKCYLKQLDDGSIKRKVAGCPKECAKNINFENFGNGLCIEKGKKLKQKVTGGIVIGTTNFTIKI